jgi:hypothetical protein
MSMGSGLRDQLASGDGGSYTVQPAEFAAIKTYLLEEIFK